MRKITRGRRYAHQKREFLKGTAIMLSGGVPYHLAEEFHLNGKKHTSNSLALIPFEHKRGADIAESTKKHDEKVESVMNKLRTTLGVKYNISSMHGQNVYIKTGQIIKFL